MLVSLNWLKGGLQTDGISDEELVKLIGSRLVEIEEVIDETHKYDKIYVVEVRYCEKIPDTHLSLCKIDDGGIAEDVERDADGLVQVMCGAPNVHKGMFAAWVAPGAIVPATFRDAEPFKIGMRKMLNKYDSYGMLAGADELDFGDDHSGIVELDPSTTKVGKTLSATFGNLDDKILDIENKSLTHRPDTFGILGFRREVAGILGQKHESEDWYLDPEQKFENDPSIKLDIEIDTNLCPRYTAIVFNNLEKEEQHYLNYEATILARSGMRPVNHIVDATNLLMLAFGQPLHAFDYDKFVKVGGSKNPKIIVRAAKSGEKLELLDGNIVELNTDDIVITSNNVPVALAGAMGGASTAIDENTKRIILESATFSLYNLRKTQMAHGIFSEAITRFTKGQPAGQTKAVALRFVDATAKYLEPLAFFDSQKAEPDAEKITLTISQINNLLGTNFTIDEVKTILENVEFEVDVKDDTLMVEVPFWRTDIHIPEDVIEEVGRLSGYDNIAPILPLHATADPNQNLELKTTIRDFLAARGANEVLTYSFIHGKLIEKVGQNPANSYKIVNSISPDLQYIRQSIVPSLLDKAYPNIRAGHDKFALFEMNQAYSRSNGVDEDGVPRNTNNLGFIFVDNTIKNGDTNYYAAKKYLDNLLKTLNISFTIKKIDIASDAVNAYYEPKRSASIYCGDDKIGDLGEIKRSVLRSFKLPAGVAAFELDLDKLLSKIAHADHKNFAVSQYPFVSRDVTISVALDAEYEPLEQQIRQIFENEGYLYRLTCTSIYHAADTDTKNISFHIDFANPTKTLEKAEINAIMSKVDSIK